MIRPIDVALTQLGIVEDTGSNDGVPADRYMRGDRLAWCAGFVLWCYDESDDPDIWDDRKLHTKKDHKRYWRLRSVSSLIAWAHKMKVFIEPNVLPAPNDLIFYGSRLGSDKGKGNHVGIVHTVSYSYIHTVEGNLADSVKKREVIPGGTDILGYARFSRRP